jgi:hypothetical protein
MEETPINTASGEDTPLSGAFPVSDNTIAVLQCLAKLMPYLDDNLGMVTAYRELGRITSDEYQYTLTRHRDANLILSIVDLDAKCISDEKLAHIPNFEDRINMIASWCIVDVRAHATEDLKGEEQAKLMDLIDALCEALKVCGYTKILPTFKIPMK